MKDLLFQTWLRLIFGFGFLQYLIPLLAGAAGGLLNRGKTTKQEGTQNSTSTTNINYDPETQALKDSLTSNYMNMLPGTPGYQNFINQGVSGINHGSDLIRQNLQGILAARGINGPAAGNAEAGLESNRFSNILNFKQNAPTQALSAASQFFTSLPKSTITTSSGTSTGSSTEPGNIAGGITGSLAQVLAYLYGQGAMGNTVNKAPTSVMPNIQT